MVEDGLEIKVEKWAETKARYRAENLYGELAALEIIFTVYEWRRERPKRPPDKHLSIKFDFVKKILLMKEQKDC